ncbi:hypothetical protein D3C71_1693680 [compost metagenome]
MRSLGQRYFGRVRKIQPAGQIGAAGQLLHVDVRRMEQAALVGDGDHRLGVLQAAGDNLGAFQRIDGDVDGRPLLVADLLADVQHGRVVHFAFADHNRPVDGDGIKHGANGRCRRIVRGILVSPADPAGRSQSTQFRNPYNLQSQFTFHCLYSLQSIFDQSIYFR